MLWHCHWSDPWDVGEWAHRPPQKHLYLKGHTPTWASADSLSLQLRALGLTLIAAQAGAVWEHASLIYMMLYFVCVSLSTEQKQRERCWWGRGWTILAQIWINGKRVEGFVGAQWVGHLCMWVWSTPPRQISQRGNFQIEEISGNYSFKMPPLKPTLVTQ